MSSFDNIAGKYDKIFTHSLIGQKQRGQVWSYIDQIISERDPLHILELNCGTGEDAVYFARKGHTVLATDASEKMLEACKKKMVTANPIGMVQVACCDLKSLEKLKPQNKFDLVFSNFGGLNCINADQLQYVSRTVSGWLNSRGRFIGVLMPKFCLWESLYYLVKGKRIKIFRRLTDKSLKVNIEGSLVRTWYYTPGEVVKIFGSRYTLQKIKPIGICLPPSYMENFFKRKLKWLTYLEIMENRINRLPFLAYVADHYLIDFEIS